MNISTERTLKFIPLILRNPYQLKKKYLDKYDIDKKKLKAFIDDFWYELFNEDDFKIIAIVIDKSMVKTSTKTALEEAINRVILLIKRRNLYVKNVVIDQMDARINTHQNQQGYIYSEFSKKLGIEVKFQSSKNSNFLQLTDTVAYNVLRQSIDAMSKKTPRFEKFFWGRFSFYGIPVFRSEGG